MYARWTTTILCSSMVQMSAQPCGLDANASRPLCADTCAEFAQSEAFITADKNLCSNPNQDLSDLIRADFTVCGLPEQSLTGRCVAGAENEAENCGFGNSTLGLCSYCGSGGTNSTDTCCYNSKAESRCEGVTLPTITPSLTFITATESTSPTSTTTSSPGGTDQDKDEKDDKGGLSGGAIAGIVIGVLAGVALLAVLLFFCIRILKRRQGSQAGSVFNQPSPARKVTPNMAQPSRSGAPQGYEVLPGGRIARMSALEGHSGNSPSQNGGSPRDAAYLADSKKNSDHSSSDGYGESPVYEQRHGGLRPPPMAARRNGSLSSGSVLGSEGHMSPGSNGFSSPLGVASQQSEQLPFFKDYYSQDDIHPSDRVAVLWAYSPRAGDEFALERGDMIKVVGIWDDGWATGVMTEDRAEDWDARRHMQRDSGVSNTSGAARDASPPSVTNGEMKAFPLVCVCLPQHWRKTIEGDGSTESGSITAVGRSTA